MRNRRNAEQKKEKNEARSRKPRRRRHPACLPVIGSILLLLAVFILSPFSKYLVSLGVMSVYSGMHERNSVMQEKGIELWIPGGGITEETDWYPFVMTFQPSDESFCRFIGEEDRELTILYNFPAFDLRWGKGCSRLYDIGSPYYNAFYGAYLVTDTDETDKDADTSAAEAERKRGGRPPFGFRADGSLDLSKTGLVPQYDFEKLVLADFGISAQEMRFQWTVRNMETADGFLDYDSWTRVDADLTVSGAFHRAARFRQSYLQYGTPKYDAYPETDFAPAAMYGRVYARYFPEWDSSVFFYVMAGSQEIVDACDRNILQKSRLR